MKNYKYEILQGFGNVFNFDGYGNKKTSTLTVEKVYGDINDSALGLLLIGFCLDEGYTKIMAPDYINGLQD